MLVGSKPESEDLFVRRNDEKEYIRMRDYRDPNYGKAMKELLRGGPDGFSAPVRAKVR